jgi:hypothetical protein
LLCKNSQNVVNAQFFQNSDSELLLAVHGYQDRIQYIIQPEIFVFLMLLKDIHIYCLLFVMNLGHIKTDVFKSSEL